MNCAITNKRVVIPRNFQNGTPNGGDNITIARGSVLIDIKAELYDRMVGREEYTCVTLPN